MKSFNEYNLNESRLNERMKINQRAYKQHELDDIVETIGANTNPANFAAAILQDLDDRFEILEEILEYFR